MASNSRPRPGYNGGALTVGEAEQLVHAIQPDGLIGTPADLPAVYADGTGTRVVKIRANQLGLLRGTQWDSGPTDFSLPSLPANGTGNPRKDLIVARLVRAAGAYTITETSIQGTAAATPVAPAPVQGVGASDSWDLPLAEVTVAAGATSLAAGTVLPRAWYIGSDGQILCTVTTRPGHEVGRVIQHTDLGGERLRSTGTAWVGISPRKLFRTTDQDNFTMTYVNDNVFQWAVEANSRYEITGSVMIGATSVEPGIKLAWSMPAGASVLWTAPGVDTGGGFDSTWRTASNGQILRRTSSGAGYSVIVNGIITVGATAGNAILQFGQWVTSLSAARMGTGSVLGLQKIS